MKTSDGFDARRLRPRGQGNWGKRIGTLIALLLVVAGLLLAVAGASSLTVHPQMLGELNASPGGAAFVAIGGLLVLYIGVWLWRRCRRQRSGGGLRHLFASDEKHN
ncbi:hypothetical protein HG619_26025 [Pseudomonas syringae]|nr:hypothetical protein [Pseudomonas syringae]